MFKAILNNQCNVNTPTISIINHVISFLNIVLISLNANQRFIVMLSAIWGISVTFQTLYTY